MSRRRNAAWQPPIPEQREILRVVLLADFPNRDAIAAHFADIRVQRGCNCGCGSFDFRLPSRIELKEQDWPVQLSGVSTNGIGALILLFRKDGRDFSLEVAPVEDGDFGQIDPSTISDFDRSTDTTGPVPMDTLTSRALSLIEEHALRRS